MVQKVGVILPSLYSQQIVYEVFKGISSGLKHTNDAVIFFEDFTPLMFNPPCAIMHIHEIYNFKGTLISTTLNNTLTMINMVTPSRKIFYIWDLEWLRGHNNFLDNLAIYRNNNIDIITRSHEYANEIENYSNRRPIVETIGNVICNNLLSQ